MNEHPDLVACLKKKFRVQLLQNYELATNLYRSLCNQQYVHKKTGYTFFPTWRRSGAIVAEIRGIGEEYTEFYCSGGENCVMKDAYRMIKKCGWRMQSYTLTQRIDARRKTRIVIKQLKAEIKTCQDPHLLSLYKILLRGLK